MDRSTCTRLLYEELRNYSLNDWHVRYSSDDRSRFLGLCSYQDKCIIVNTHHLDLHPDEEIIDTLKHEVAHALTPGHGHDAVWREKAIELGAKPYSCSHLNLPPDIIDAIRSNADVEVTYQEEVIRRPQYKVTRLQDKCPTCGKVAIQKKETLIPNKDETKPDMLFILLECGHTIFKQVPKGTPFHLFQAFGDPNCKHEWDPEEVNTCVLCGRKRPYPFQIEGMKFGEKALAIGSGVALLDEMGLGKTIQAGGIVYFDPTAWPVLWVVKSSLKFPTFKFIIDWMGNEHVAQIIHTSSDILIPGLKHYIISYDLMVPKTKRSKSGKIIHIGFDVQKIIDSPIKTIILDECQLIKNTGSGRTREVRKICKGRRVITLSGTPWKNRGGELYSMFNLIAPMKFAFHNKFLERWVDFVWKGRIRVQAGIKNPDQFKEYIKDIAIRRERKDVMPDLPQVTRTKLLAKLSAEDEAVYDAAVEAFVQWYQDAVAHEEANGFNILGKISRLRHLTGIAKIGVTINHIQEFIEDTDRKIVVFRHHDDVGESLYLQCRDKFELGKGTNEDADEEDEAEPFEPVPVMNLTSDLSPEERFAMQNRFNELPRAILIASTLASGEGLNLQTCSDCIMHERQWNPANEEQAEGRFIRIGQKSDKVNAVYAQVVDSIDDYLAQIVEKKRRYFHAAMNTGEAPKWNQDDILKELAEVIVRKHYQKKNKGNGGK